MATRRNFPWRFQSRFRLLSKHLNSLRKRKNRRAEHLHSYRAERLCPFQRELFPLVLRRDTSANHQFGWQPFVKANPFLVMTISSRLTHNIAVLIRF